MQKLLIIIALLFSYFFTVNAQKDKLNQLFEKYQEADGVTSIKISKPMFSMLNKLNIDDEELNQIKPLLNKINGLKILIVEKPKISVKPEDIKLENQFQKLQADISGSLKSMNYEELITVNSKDNKIKFLSAEATNGILDDLLLSINSEGNTMLLMLDGKISMDDVNNLVNEAQKTTSIDKGTGQNDTSRDVSQNRNVGKFMGIAVSSGIKLNFTQGNNQSVIVDTDDNMQQFVTTKVVNGILEIKVADKANRKMFRKLIVHIEAPRLTSVKVSSGALFTALNTINESDFATTISSGANLNADVNIENAVTVDISSGANAKIDVQSQTFKLEASSGSMSTITGKSGFATFHLSSAAACNAQNLVAKKVNAQTSSGANLKINATESLKAVSSSGSSVRYAGNPKIQSGDLSTSSGGSIKPLN